MDARYYINDIANRQGWSERTKFELLCRFIDNLEVLVPETHPDGPRLLHKWLENQVAWRNHNVPSASRSISDDDVCADCRHCIYRPGEESICRLGWPATPDEDGNITECGDHKAVQSFTPRQPDEVQVMIAMAAEAEEKIPYDELEQASKAMRCKKCGNLPERLTRDATVIMRTAMGLKDAVYMFELRANAVGATSEYEAQAKEALKQLKEQLGAELCQVIFPEEG